MQHPIRRLRSLLDARVQAWIKRRQGIDPDPLLLHRRRIYILPTRLGFAYAAMLFGMVLGGMNYNNLGLGLAFLLVSLGLVTMHHATGRSRDRPRCSPRSRHSPESRCSSGCCSRTARRRHARINCPRTTSWEVVDVPRRVGARAVAGLARAGAIPAADVVATPPGPVPGMGRRLVSAIAWPKPAVRGSATRASS
jgi:hypothetical protein